MRPKGRGYQVSDWVEITKSGEGVEGGRFWYNDKTHEIFVPVSTLELMGASPMEVLLVAGYDGTSMLSFDGEGEFGAPFSIVYELFPKHSPALDGLRLELLKTGGGVSSE